MSTAVVFDEYGSPSVLHPAEVKMPAPGPGQALIKVRAASINPFDLKVRAGYMQAMMPINFPGILGLDAAGVVEAVGEGATVSVGDEVFGGVVGGGYREYAVLGGPVAKPAALSFESAASIVTVGSTADRVLRELNAQPGQTLLVHGAAGSVGIIAAQIAVAEGLTVLGTAAPADQDQLVEIGVTPIVYGDGWADRVRAAAPDGVDIVFDTTGAGLLGESVELVGDASRVITIADNSAAEHGVKFSGGAPLQASVLAGLAQLAADGKLVLPIGRTYPLAEAAQAHADLEARLVRGKVVLVP